VLRTRLLLFLRLFRAQWGIYSLKLVSLAIAFACTILVVAFASKEFDVNESQPNSGQIVRVIRRNDAIDYNRNRLSDRIPVKVQKIISSVSGDSIEWCRVTVLEQVIATGTKRLRGTPFHAVDPSVINVFDFDIAHGDLANFDKGSILLSSSSAIALFGNEASAGQRVDIATTKDTVALTVAAVFRDWKNMHEKFQVLLANEGTARRLGYTDSASAMYGRTHASLDLDALATNIATKSAEQDISYRLQPLREIYFGPRVTGENARHGDSYSVWILICISSLILLLAISNYANLTTLTLPARSVELAIGKVAGANSFTLCLRLLQESLTMCAMAMMAGVGVLALSASTLQTLFAIDVTAWTHDLSWSAVAALLLIFGIAIAAPTYQIIVFTSATPRRLLSTEVISFPAFKRVITILQLGVSISLIAAGLVIERQIDRSLIKEPGWNQDQVVYLRYPDDLTRLDDMKLGWKRNNPNIVGVTAASQLPNYLQSRDTSGRFHRIVVEHDFFSFFGMEIVKGRGFRVNDQDSVMVNAQGAALDVTPAPIGVVSDFSSAFNQPASAVQIRQTNDYRDYAFLFIRIYEVNIRDTKAYLTRFFKEIGVADPQISFLDPHYENVLLYEDTLNGLSRLLTAVGIAMACCAIYALGLSRLNDNLKQIAIRRTFGATRAQIVTMLSREILERLLAAVLFFGPVTFLLLRTWLKNFVYAAKIHWADPVLALAVCAAIVVAINLTLIFNLGRTATSDALRR
jgi:putative ABC transport system permease protein